MQEIASRYPDVPLSTVLIAEKKFVEADLDRNGVRKIFKVMLNFSFYKNLEEQINQRKKKHGFFQIYFLSIDTQIRMKPQSRVGLENTY